MEEWRWVIGYEQYFQVSSDGRVKSVAHYGRRRTDRILTPSLHKTGYLNVCLCVARKAVHRTVHLLVARAFLGPAPEGTQVNHKDGVKTNNKAMNLEYVTHLENMRHAYSNGLCRPAKGEQHGMAKLNADKVREIRRLHGQRSGVELAKQFGVTPSAITLIVKRKKWAHVN